MKLNQFQTQIQVYLITLMKNRQSIMKVIKLFLLKIWRSLILIKRFNFLLLSKLRNNTSKKFCNSARSEVNNNRDRSLEAMFRSWDYSDEIDSNRLSYSYIPRNAPLLNSNHLSISHIMDQNSRNYSVISMSIQENRIFKLFKSS